MPRMTRLASVAVAQLAIIPATPPRGSGGLPIINCDCKPEAGIRRALAQDRQT